MNTKLWLHGLVGAVIGGGANAVTLIAVDPNTFNIYQGWKNLLSATIVSGIVSGAFYLKKSPVPEEIITDTKSPSIKDVLMPLVMALGLVMAACSTHYNSLPQDASAQAKSIALAQDAKDWLANEDHQRTVHDALVITGRILIDKAVDEKDKQQVRNEMKTVSAGFLTIANGNFINAEQVNVAVQSFGGTNPTKYSDYVYEANIAWQLIYSKLNLANDPTLIKKWLILLADAAQLAAQ